jgi:hypothetical protein
VAESITKWLGAIIDKMGKNGPREITFNFLTVADGITLLCVECFDKATCDAIIKEAPRADLLACYIADTDSIPKIASAIRGKSVIRFRLPQGLNFNDPISINAHVGHVIQNLNRGLCTMGGWEGTVLRLDQATVTFHSPSSPIISALAGIVTIVAGPHKDEKITRLPIYVVAPDKYELKRGTRVELKLPINSVDIDPPAIVSALVAVSSTQLNPRKGDITVAYVAFCSACRKAGHATKGCPRDRHNSVHHFSVHPGSGDQALARPHHDADMHEAGNSDGGAWHSQGKRSRK